MRGNEGKLVGRRPVIAGAATTLVAGLVAGCTSGADAAGKTSSTSAATAAGRASAGAASVEVGKAPSQDVMALYAERSVAIGAALKKLPTLVTDAMSSSKVPGVSVAVVSNGKTVYQGAFGVKNVRTGEKVDAQTVFEIASLSKPISATVVAKVISESESLSWATPVSTVLPGFSLADPYVTAHATIGDFFSHRTGIPTGGGDDLEDIGFDRDYILAHLKYIPLAPFRTTYQYSNFGLTTGAVAAATSRHASWEDTAEQLLFKPLGMTSTTSSHQQFLAVENRAVQHARIGEDDFQPLFDRDPDAEAPAGGIASTAGDIAKWMALVLVGGRLNGRPFIEAEPLMETFAAQIVTSHNSELNQRPSHYGFGVNVNSGANGRVVLSHSGAFGWGTATAATLLPDLGLGIVVLTNGAPIGLPEAVTQGFVDQVMYGKQTRDWVAAFRGRFEGFNDPSGDLAGKTAPAGAKAPGPLTDYVGSYHSDYFSTLTVSVKNGALHAAMGPNGGYTFAIERWDGDTLAFVPTGENALPGSRSSAKFARTGGRVSGVTLAFFNKFPQVETPSGLGVFTRTD